MTAPAPRPHRTRTRVLALLVTAALVVTGCSSDGDDPTPSSTTRRSTTTEAPATTSTSTSTTTTTTADPGVTTTTTPGAEPLDWSACDGGFECAELEVPIDHRNPRGDTLTLGLARREALKPDERIGVLLMNPGGPGGSAVDLIESSPLPNVITDRFDIVGFDPRGVGRSTPLDCRTHLQAIYDADPTIDEPDDATALLEASEAFVGECEEKYADLLPFLGTADVARDMDLVRAALGEEQVSYLGYSYGTSIGQQYARLFPTRIRAMVLDGVVDESKTGLDSAIAQARGFAKALGAFVEACGEDLCGSSQPMDEVIDAVLASSERTPIPARGADRPATPGVVALALARGLYSAESWPQLGRALSQARAGNGTGLVRMADSYLHRAADGSYPNGFEVYFGVSCLDSVWPDDPQIVMDVAKVVGVELPQVGEGLVNDYVRCALWPVPPNPLTPVSPATQGLPPIVIVSTTGDPATPYESGVAVAGQIPGSILVTNEGEGHTVYPLRNGCIDEAVNAYLIDLTAPEQGLTC